MNRFREWQDAGFTGLLPVIPPEGSLSPDSSIPPENRGKVPGRLRPLGWVGLSDWTTFDIAPLLDQVATWYPGTPSIGLLAASFPAVDLDVEDESLCAALSLLAERTLGPAPCRTRKTSRRLLMYRKGAEQRWTKKRLAFSWKGKQHAVEILGEGCHYLIEGQHRSGEEYQWDWLPQARDLSEVTTAQLNRFLAEARAFLQALGVETNETGTAVPSEKVPDPVSLYAPDLMTLQALVSRIPNISPSREHYINMGLAIKAAGRPGEGDALFGIWWGWCARWEGGTNEEEVAHRDWSRMHPPFRLGYPWLLDQVSGAAADLEFEPLSLLEPPKPQEDSGCLPFSDAWIAQHVFHRFGQRIRFTAALGGWMTWEGHRWCPDEHNRVPGMVAEVCRLAGEEALRRIEKKREAETTARYCHSDRSRKNVQSYLSTDPRINLPVAAYDKDIWKLNTPEGVVDLRTGFLHPNDPHFLCTRSTAVSPRITPTPLWTQFLRDVTGSDAELEGYLQRLLGYSLTGSTREHVLAFLWGRGGNGKGVFLNTLVNILGSYAVVSAMDTFTASLYDRHPADLAALAGARLVTAQETQKGRHWDEAKIKSLTGGDTISARFMRGNFFSYRPQFTLVFAGNHRPHLWGLDAAMRRRFHLVPFTTVPENPDPNLQEALVAEWPGILQWTIEGCLAWQKQGLRAPQAVAEATETYFTEEDPLVHWLQDQTEPDPEGEEHAKALWDSWRNWCRERAEKTGTLREFKSALAEHGLAEHRSPSTRERQIPGIRLRPDLPPIPADRTVLH